MSALSGWPVLLVLVCTVALIVLLTEITSNTATTAAFLPILGAVAIGFGENPFLLAVPAALGASCAFMLPVATPPNAIVYGSGLLSILQMSRVGVWLNLLFIVVVTDPAYSLLGVAYGVEIDTVPSWTARGGRVEVSHAPEYECRIALLQHRAGQSLSENCRSQRRKDESPCIRLYRQ